jgi:hypothetical protein
VLGISKVRIRFQDYLFEADNRINHIQISSGGPILFGPKFNPFILKVFQLLRYSSNFKNLTSHTILILLKSIDSGNTTHRFWLPAIPG